MFAAIFPSATTANARGVKASQLLSVIKIALNLPRNGTNVKDGTDAPQYPTLVWHPGITHTDGRVAVPVRQRLLTMWDAAHDAIVPSRITQAQFDAMRGTIVDGLATTLTSDWYPNELPRGGG